MRRKQHPHDPQPRLGPDRGEHIRKPGNLLIRCFLARRCHMGFSYSSNSILMEISQDCKTNGHRGSTASSLSGRGLIIGVVGAFSEEEHDAGVNAVS
jgi:hypothetical protein